MEKRNIELPNGSMLEVEATERFYEAIRFEYSLDKNATISDDHIRMFVYGTMNNAVAEAEKEITINRQ
tara:strand:+ start:1864 stop:2067 length:204 start_codon:yes stop_codon:yes gene_type:complete